MPCKHGILLGYAAKGIHLHGGVCNPGLLASL